MTKQTVGRESEAKFRQCIPAQLGPNVGHFHETEDMCRENWKGRFVLGIVAGLLRLACAGAQGLPESVVQLIEQQASEGQPYEDLGLYYEDLARRHPSINSLRRRELEEFRLLSIFQIESILDYRRKYGDILSEGELALVDGFNARTAALCSSFFCYSSSSPIAQPYEDPDWSHTATLKAKTAFDSSGTGVTLKYLAEYGDSWSLGFTADNDAGEALRGGWVPDFISVYGSYRGDGMLRQLIVGDYTVRAGQGLALWKAFKMSSSGAPSTISRNPQCLRPYTSSDEANFFRGAAATLSAGSGELLLFASFNALDARVLGDSLYTSIVTGGYHRTDTELSKRHAMHEFVAGGHFGAEAMRLRYGVTVLAYRYDKANGRRVADYNRYQIYDGWWGNASADIYCFWKDLRIFGEAATDAHFSGALLAGAVWSPCYELETGLLGRLYSRSYIATHAGAYSSLSSCSNQRGVTLSAKWIFAQDWILSGYAQYSYYPWSRYGIAGPSSAFKYQLGLERSFGKESSADVRLNGNPSPRWRANAVWAVNSHWRLTARYAGNPSACGGFLECAYSPSRKLKLSVRVTACRTSGWDDRLYFYEGGVPQSFNIEPWYGKRKGVYLLVKYTPFRNVDFWHKASDRGLSYLTRIF